ncbi:hypothetical protein MPNT_90018 [Candidatus Methylacidithermus pantelleriae]|uniref:Uncharacterized protein n=1 Tax=Candidatus Methylacidithermus pantelleriae TaxID=2744239 RepID=A0A8J2BRR0_9BACT|nr:hypothetical protein MPNT_90018 [Candidatus Methylacidithermus pantelleriae]
MRACVSLKKLSRSFLQRLGVTAWELDAVRVRAQSKDRLEWANGGPSSWTKLRSGLRRAEKVIRELEERKPG